MAAPNFIAASTATFDANSVVTVNIPGAGSGVAAGQRAILVVCTNNQDPSATPTGWTFVGSTPDTDSFGQMHIYTCVISDTADVDPGDTVTVNKGGSSRAALAVLVYEASTIDASALDGGGGGRSTITTPTASASDAARVVHLHGCNTSSSGAVVTWTPDGATTERVDICSTAGAARNSTLCAADEVIAAPGSTTARTATPTANVQRGAAVIVLNTAVTRPVADAGPDQNVLAGATVNLDGSATDGGGAGGPYTWQWTQVSGATVTLNDTTAENPTFTAPSVTSTLVFELVATDSGSVASLADSVTISVLGPENTSVPISDDLVTGWTTEPGGAAGVYEVTSDSSDATYAISPDSPTNHPLRLELAPFSDPATSDLVAISVRARKVSATTGSITLSLLQGNSPGTVLATDTFALTDVIEQYTLTLTPTEIGNITDPDNLYGYAEVSAS